MKAKRIIFGATMLAMAAASHAQTTSDQATQLVLDDLNVLRRLGQIEVQVTSTQWTYVKRSDLSGTLYFETSLDPRTGTNSIAKIELDEMAPDSTGQPRVIRRIVGDGTTLWTYDLLRREFSADAYGFYGSKPPANYVGSDAPRMLGLFNSRTRGSYEWVARLLHDINFGPDNFVSTFNPWVSGQTADVASNHTNNGLTYQAIPDPINPAWSFVAAPIPSQPITRDYYLLGTTDGTTDRSAEFELSYPQAGSAPYVSNVFLSERRKDTVTATSLQLLRDYVLPTGAFVPYDRTFIQGWKPILSWRPFSG